MLHGNIATDGYGLNRNERANIPTDGYGQGVVVLLGGSVVDEAEQVLVDFEVFEDLVADVEEALAPVADLGLLEETLTFELSITQPVIMGLEITQSVDITAQETVTELEPTDTGTLSLSATDQATVGLEPADGLSSDLTANETPTVSIEGDDDLSGK